jgi:hypothetical protein
VSPVWGMNPVCKLPVMLTGNTRPLEALLRQWYNSTQHDVPPDFIIMGFKK